MNYYETLYIVHPALDAGRLKDIITGVDDSLKKMGGNPLAVELWGKRKLAYFIDKQKYGTYVLVQYNGEGKCTSNFAVELEHNPNILAYLTTSIEKDKVIEQEEDIETQIAGKTREAERSEARRGKGKEVAVVETDIKESDAPEIKKGDKSPEDESEQTDPSTEERDADSTEIKAETTESEDKENDSTEDETPEESSDSEADKDVDTPEENSDAQVTDEESSAEIAESESDEENTTSEESTEKESETKQEKAEDEPAAVSEEEK